MSSLNYGWYHLANRWEINLVEFSGYEFMRVLLHFSLSLFAERQISFYTHLSVRIFFHLSIWQYSVFARLKDKLFEADEIVAGIENRRKARVNIWLRDLFYFFVVLSTSCTDLFWKCFDFYFLDTSPFVSARRLRFSAQILSHFTLLIVESVQKFRQVIIFYCYLVFGTIIFKVHDMAYFKCEKRNTCLKYKRV